MAPEADLDAGTTLPTVDHRTGIHAVTRPALSGAGPPPVTAAVMGYGRRHPRGLPQLAGLMLTLRWKKLSGSYTAFSRVRRSKFFP